MTDSPRPGSGRCTTGRAGNQTFLHELVQSMVATALRLEGDGCCCPSGSMNRGDAHDSNCPLRSVNPVHQAWANHLRQDAKSLRLLAETWREA